MEQSFNVMWVHSYVIVLVDISYFFFSFSLVRQLFNRNTTVIFYRCSDGYVATDPWLGFRVWGDKVHFRGEKFLFLFYVENNYNMTNASVKVPWEILFEQ